ncbi:MAG: hypothetical protein EBS07_12325 [Sphingobacteriia bacterium]|nr:hypothetical protein [Sphingobacteriia bacterium]
MALERTISTDRQGLNSLIGVSGAYNLTYGITTQGYLKPFTTNTGIVGVPHYTHSILLANNPTGFFGASSSGLNPFGPNTLNEGIVHGNSLPGNLDASINAHNVRTYGFKTPINYVGVGFDIFGYPAPNSNLNWNVSGVLGSGTPTSGFLGSGFQSVPHLRDVPSYNWLAGPQDLRWNALMGTWTSPQSVYAGKILKAATVSGDVNPTGVFFAKDLRYDVRVLDGIANAMQITGIMHSGPKPTGYKVLPFSSGDFCFIVHDQVSGKPVFSAFMMELPGLYDCNAGGSSLRSGGGESVTPVDTYEGASESEPWNTTYYLNGSGLFNGLAYYPLPLIYGGLGLNSISHNEILIGSGSVLTRKTLAAGSGIGITIGSTGISIALSGVSFNLAGTNSNITELTGLTTPLSVSQGGTGASGITFVSITGNQNINGTKQFFDIIKLGSGLSSVPSLSFINNGSIGLSLQDPVLRISNSGNILQSVNPSGIYFYGVNHFQNTLDNFNPGLVVTHNLLGSVTPLEVRDTSGNYFFAVSQSGIHLGLPNNRSILKTASGSYALGTVELPTGGLLTNSASVREMFQWNEVPSGAINGVNLNFILDYPPISSKTIMLFKNGLLQSYSDDYNVSGVTISFVSAPASGSKIIASYQYNCWNF